MGGASYARRVKALFGSALIGYWPLDEAAGPVAVDRSSQTNDGAYSNVTLSNALAPLFMRTRCPAFNGSNSQVDIYSAGLAADFNGAEGAMGIWLKVSDVADWNTLNLSPFGFQADVANRLFARTGAGSHQLNLFYIAGNISVGSISLQKLNNFNGWLELWFSWSDAANEFNVYCNGLLCEWQKFNAVNFPLAISGEWAGALSSTGANIGTHSASW